MIYIFSRVLIAIAVAFIIKQMLLVSGIFMNGFLLRLKSVLKGDDFLDVEFKNKKKFEKVKTKPEETIICFDPPPFYDFFDQRD